ncbi:hypothetical protein I79_005450 [Cricetulus griseus]|uniref:Uncharacterized protein n=1 Tax=Cricetulus griseus TaxID=10029 RepID=G3H575_CRIGR|nr:hypothetical protein I79_005450 [Cricetulus griseus]
MAWSGHGGWCCWPLLGRGATKTSSSSPLHHRELVKPSGSLQKCHPGRTERKQNEKGIILV